MPPLQDVREIPEPGSHSDRPDPRKLAREFNAFTKPKSVRSFIELAITFVPYCVLFGLTLWAVYAGYYLALAMVPLAALFLLRLFIVQHDCGHGSFLKSSATSDWIGRIIGVLTLTPYACWRRNHALHHAGTGNLDARGHGDVDTLTVREFRELSPFRRVFYRLYRHPALLMIIGPAYLFLIQHRLPIGLMDQGRSYWVSAMATTVIAVSILAGLSALTSPMAVALVYLPTLIIAASLGVWLFYVQHQFEGAYWQNKPDWQFHDAALGGSTFLDLPAPMAWFTGNIGIHHIHHLASRVPFYRLPEVLKAHPEMQSFNRITALQSLRALNLALWDEDSGRMMTFREAAAVS